MARAHPRRARSRALLALGIVAGTLVAVGSPAPAEPVTTTFTPAADARVEQAKPKSNYGRSSQLGVDRGTSDAVRSYLTFKVGAVAGPVTSARLRLRVLDNGSADPTSVATTASSWSESKITWRNAPAVGARLAGAGSLPAGTWVEYDVAAAVTGPGTYAFVVTQDSGSDGADFASRESSSDPQLVVTSDVDTVPPSATLTAPAAGSTLSGTVTVTAGATDNTSVARVTLVVDGAATGTADTTAPYSLGLDTTALGHGPHSLAVEASDPAGNTGRSASVDVTVDNLPDTGPAQWRQAGPEGAGYMNSVAFAPDDAQRALLATDVGGIHLSRDGGSSWAPRGRAVAENIASVAWHPTLPGVAYALAGRGSAGTGGVAVSSDGGESWRLGSTAPTGHGNIPPSGDGLPRPHPRSTGQLLAVDAAGGWIYAGTYAQGLMRAPLGAGGDPGAWTVAALPPVSGKPYFIRGIALDDTQPGTVYVATYPTAAGAGNGRVYRVSGAGTSTPVVTELTGGPRFAEEVRVLDGHLYAVANDPSGAGVGAFRLAVAGNASAGTAWRRLAAGPSVTTVSYYGLEVTASGSTTTMWVTSDTAWRPDSTVAYKPIWRGTSSDGFATDGTWAALPGALADTPNDRAGPHATPDPWWAINESTYAWLGRDSGYTASGVAVSPADPDTVILAGQGGPWRTRDGGRTWYPVPEGIGILLNARVTTDPGQPGRVYLGSADFRGFSSADGLDTFRHLGVALKQAGVPSTAGDGWSVAVDTAAPGPDRPVYLGLGERDVNTDGQIWTDPDPSTPTTGWTKVMDGSVTGGKRPIGLAVVRDPAAPTTPVVLAVVQGSGLWRKVGSGAWAQAAGFTSPIVDGLVFPQAVTFAWRPGWHKVYAYDRSSGLWRSDDFGGTWARLASSPDTRQNRQGFVAAHPSDEGIVYLSTSAGLSVVANAGVAGAGGAVLSSLGLPAGAGVPGPLAVGPDGRISVATQASAATGPSALLVGRVGTAGPLTGGWADAADDVWRNAISAARELAVGADGTLYAGTTGGAFVLDGGGTPG